MSKRVLTLVLAVSLMLVLVIPSAGAISTMYVYTANGRTLNVRSTPSTGDNIIGSLKYGAEVGVERFLDNGWAAIVWGSYGTAYVQSRYLQWYKPGPKPTAAPTAKPAPAPAAGIAALNQIFRTGKSVTPYTVVVRPSRSSGWVNMRWAPSTEAEVFRTYKDGARLTVIADLDKWYQVVDPETEATGFMMKNFTVNAN